MNVQGQPLNISFSSSRKFLVSSDEPVDLTYSHLYFSRQAAMRSNCFKTAKILYDTTSVTLCQSIMDIKPNEPSVVFGTLYKKMKLKPRVLDQLTLLGIQSPLPKESYIDETDQILLDDGHSRVELIFPLSSKSENPKSETNNLEEEEEDCPTNNSNNIYSPEHSSVSTLVTGIICSVYGVLDASDNTFHTTKIIFPLPKPKIPLGIQIPTQTEPNFICFASNINISHSGHDGHTSQMIYPLLLDFLRGDYLTPISSKLKLFCVLGNVAQFPRIETAANVESNSQQRRKRDLSTLDNESKQTLPLELTDYFISKGAENVPFLLLPGDNDPINYSLPQQPLQTSILFPVSNRKVGAFREKVSKEKANLFPDTPILTNNVKSLTNPSIFTVSNWDTTFLATSGQNISSISSYSTLTNPLEALSASLHWNHISPTCPDTTPCFPFRKSDPFIIDTLPDVYIAGNQPEYQSAMISVPARSPDSVKTIKQQVQIVSVPKFDSTGILVLYDLNSKIWSTITLATSPQ